MKLALAFVALVANAAVAMADSLPMPEGRVLLTVTGAIKNTNVDETAQFDRAMLEEIGWRTFETHTFWTEGPQEFSGVPLAALLAVLGAGDGDVIRAAAINDYRVEIPISDAAEHDVVIALEHNGMPMRVRDKGPMWIIYPIEPSEVKDSEFNSKMIWQLSALHIY